MQTYNSTYLLILTSLYDDIFICLVIEVDCGHGVTIKSDNLNLEGFLISTVTR